MIRKICLALLCLGLGSCGESTVEPGTLGAGRAPSTDSVLSRLTASDSDTAIQSASTTTLTTALTVTVSGLARIPNTALGQGTCVVNSSTGLSNASCACNGTTCTASYDTGAAGLSNFDYTVTDATGLYFDSGRLSVTKVAVNSISALEGDVTPLYENLNNQTASLTISVSGAATFPNTAMGQGSCVVDSTTNLSAASCSCNGTNCYATVSPGAGTAAEMNYTITDGTNTYTDVGRLDIPLSPIPASNIQASDVDTDTKLENSVGQSSTLNVAVSGIAAIPNTGLGQGSCTVNFMTNLTGASCSCDGTTCRATYDTGAAGMGQIQYTVVENVLGLSDTGVLDVTVSSPPSITASDSDTASVNENQANYNTTLTVSANNGATYPGGGACSITGSTGAVTSTTCDCDGATCWAHYDTGPSGAAQITYNVTNGSQSDTGILDITIQPAVTPSITASDVDTDSVGENSTGQWSALSVSVTGGLSLPNTGGGWGTCNITGSSGVSFPSCSCDGSSCRTDYETGGAGSGFITYNVTDSTGGYSDSGRIDITITPAVVPTITASDTDTTSQTENLTGLSTGVNVVVSGGANIPNTGTGNGTCNISSSAGVSNISCGCDGTTCTLYYDALGAGAGNIQYTVTDYLGSISDGGTLSITINPTPPSITASDVDTDTKSENSINQNSNLSVSVANGATFPNTAFGQGSCTVDSSTGSVSATTCSCSSLGPICTMDNYTTSGWGTGQISYTVRDGTWAVLDTGILTVTVQAVGSIVADDNQPAFKTQNTPGESSTLTIAANGSAVMPNTLTGNGSCLVSSFSGNLSNISCQCDGNFCYMNYDLGPAGPAQIFYNVVDYYSNFTDSGSLDITINP